MSDFDFEDFLNGGPRRNAQFEAVAARCHEQFTERIELLCAAFLQKNGPAMRLESCRDRAETRTWVVRDEACEPAKLCDDCVPAEADEYYRLTDIPVTECMVVCGFEHDAENNPTFYVRYERRPSW